MDTVTTLMGKQMIEDEKNQKYQTALNRFAHANLNYRLCLDFLESLPGKLKVDYHKIGGKEKIIDEIQKFLEHHK